MANFCVNCGRKLGFRDKFTYTDKLCNKCTIALDNKRRAEAAELENKRRAEAAELENKRRAEAAELERARKAVENERNALLARVEWIIKETTPHTAVD
jgi:predicted  nucleic acid-binding Zn-ribbon protein